MTDATLRKLENDEVGKQVLSFIPHNLGIPLSEVMDISIYRDRNGNLTDIVILFEDKHWEHA